MELPQITYGPVQSSSDTAALPAQALKEGADEAAKAIYAFGQKVVQDQNEEAALRYTTSVTELKKELAQKSYYTAQEVRDAFGGREPPGVKLTESKFDTARGVETKFDREDIPSWEVADLIFAERAKKAANEASQAVTIPGWRAEFQEKALADIEGHRREVVAKQVELGQRDLKQRSLNRLDAYLTADTLESLDAAAQEVGRSTLFLPAEKEKLAAVVAQAREERPYRHAILEDVTDDATRTRAVEMMGQLKLDGALPHLDAKTKLGYRAALKKQVEDYDRRLTEDQFKVADAAAKNDVLGRMINGQRIPISYIGRFIGKVSPTALEHLMALSEKSRAEKDTVTDPMTYQFISRAITSDTEGFKNDQIRLPDGTVAPLLAFAGRLSRAHLFEFLGLQRTVREKGIEAARGYINDKTIVDSVLAGPGFEYDLNTKDENKLAEIGFLRLQADIALSQAVKDGPVSVADRYAIVKRTLAENIQKKHTYGGLGADVTELKLQGVDPAWFAEYRRLREQAGAPLNMEHAKVQYETFSTWQEGLSAAWRAQTGKAYLPMQTAIQIFDYAFNDPKNTTGVPSVNAPLMQEIDAELDKKGILRDPSNDRVNRARAALAVQAYLSALRKPRVAPQPRPTYAPGSGQPPWRPAP